MADKSEDPKVTDDSKLSIRDILTNYQIALEQVKHENARLAEENGRFRLLMLQEKTAAFDPIHLANKKIHWAELPVEELLDFLELFESHSKALSEILHLKSTKATLVEYTKQREEKKAQAAREYREKVGTGMSDEERALRKALTREDAAKEKAITGIMKSLKISREAAEAMVKSMTGGIKL